MTNPGRRRTPTDVDTLIRHIDQYGLHLHRTSNPHFRWNMIVGDEGYISCDERSCLKREASAKEAQDGS